MEILNILKTPWDAQGIGHNPLCHKLLYGNQTVVEGLGQGYKSIFILILIILSEFKTFA